MIQQRDDIKFIGIGGIPGSGKTQISKIFSSQLQNSIVIGMDGYHLPRAQLTEQQMIFRGAPDTFDKNKFKLDLQNLKINNEGKFPSFDHKLKDPIYDDIKVDKSVQKVIVEGLYLFNDDWDLFDFFDLKIFVTCEQQALTQRLAQRHVTATICNNIEEALHRVQFNDLKNGDIISNSNNLQKEGIIWIDTLNKEYQILKGQNILEN